MVVHFLLVAKMIVLIYIMKIYILNSRWHFYFNATQNATSTKLKTTFKSIFKVLAYSSIFEYISKWMNSHLL